MITRWLASAVKGQQHEQQKQQLQLSFQWLYQFVSPERRQIAALLGLSLLATSIVLLQPWLTKLLIDDGLLAGDYPMLVTMALLMVLVGLSGTLLSGMNRYFHTRLSGRILFALRADVYAHLQRLSPAFFGRRRMGDLLARLDGDVAEIQRFAVDSLFAAVSSVLGLIGAVILLLSLSWQLSLLVLVLIPLEFFWLRFMRRKVEQHTRLTRERVSDLSSFLIETLPATKFIQSCHRQDHEQQRLGQFSDRYLQQLLTQQVTEFFTQAVPSFLTSLTRATAFLVGGWWVIQGEWPLGSLIAFSTYLGMATGPVNSLLGLYVAIQRMSVSLLRVAELRQHKPEITEANNSSNALPDTLVGDIEFAQVSFAHAGREPLLQQASVVINAGEKVALSGVSGVGKSTLIDLLQRFYDPSAGQILLSGVPLTEWPLGKLRRSVAVVSQEIVLFRGSLRDNLLYGAAATSNKVNSESDITEAQLQQVINDAQLQSLVDELPGGLDGSVAERGQGLSGGQRQRIAIARALLQQPLVLVLDEATSAVDEATEQQVLSAIDRLFANTTRIIISHRASTLASCQRRLCLAEQILQEQELQAQALQEQELQERQGGLLNAQS